MKIVKYIKKLWDYHRTVPTMKQWGSLNADYERLQDAKAEEENDDTELISNEPIPTLLADGFQGVCLAGGSIRINLFEDKYDHSTNTSNRHNVTRLVIPEEYFASFVKALGEIVVQLESRPKED